MDRNSILGLFAIGVILLGFSWYSSKQARTAAEDKRIADSIARVEGRMPEEVPPGEFTPEITDTLTSSGPVASPQTATQRSDSVHQAQLGSALYDAEKGEETFYTVENDVMIITFSNRGGKVTGVELKDYKTYHGDPLMLYAPGSAYFDMTFFIRNLYGDTRVSTEDFYFTYNGPRNAAVGEGGGTFVMHLPVDSLSGIDFVYTITKDDYMIDFDVRFVNMEEKVSNQLSMLTFSWGGTAPRQEQGFDNENRYSGIVYRYPGERSVEDLGVSEATKTGSVKNNLEWIAFKQQFFSRVFIARSNFMNAELTYDTYPKGDADLKKYRAEANVLFNRNNSDYGFQFYFGPNKYSTLKAYDMKLERLVPLGWSIARWVNQILVIPAFDFLTKHLSNYGLIILLLTIMIKIIILPLTYRSYLSMGKMRLLKPEIDAISEKYPKQEDAMKKQQATMELYKRAGVSPMGGCVPMLIQLPILVSLFFFFPTAIELRGESFLWAKDLSTYDSILNLPFNIPWYGDHISLFTLLMAVSLVFTNKLNPQTQGTQQMGAMKIMMYLMPVMLLLWFNNYASGLTYYYLMSNVLTLAQTWGMKFIVNDEKLHARMKANADKKNGKTGKTAKKKSKWQQRYEEMVREQQRQAAQQAKKNR